jgi:hypothetical protein
MTNDEGPMTMVRVSRSDFVRWLLAALIVAQLFASKLGAQIEPVAPDPRLFAGWKLVQADELGDVYYFYSDGIFVRQGVRRRDQVMVGRWKMEAKSRLLLFEQEPRNSSLSAKELVTIRAQKLRYQVEFEGDSRMRWQVDDKPALISELRRIRDLPDRAANLLWGFADEESQERAMRGNAPGPEAKGKTSSPAKTTSAPKAGGK